METTTRFETNGTAEPIRVRKAKLTTASAAKTRKAPRPKLVSAAGMSRARTGITLAMGSGIPLLSLSLSHMGGGMLAGESYAMGIGMMGLCCVVLTVSLSHLAWAIGNITRSPRWASWMLAIAIDATLVSCELASSVGYESWIAAAVMVSVTVASMVLNCWAFTQHD